MWILIIIGLIAVVNLAVETAVNTRQKVHEIFPNLAEEQVLQVERDTDYYREYRHDPYGSIIPTYFQCDVIINVFAEELMGTWTLYAFQLAWEVQSTDPGMTNEVTRIIINVDGQKVLDESHIGDYYEIGSLIVDLPIPYTASKSSFTIHIDIRLYPGSESPTTNIYPYVAFFGGLDGLGADPQDEIDIDKVTGSSILIGSPAGTIDPYLDLLIDLDEGPQVDDDDIPSDEDIAEDVQGLDALITRILPFFGEYGALLGTALVGGLAVIGYAITAYKKFKEYKDADKRRQLFSQWLHPKKKSKQRRKGFK
jgi:hypothetical protein